MVDQLRHNAYEAERYFGVSLFEREDRAPLRPLIAMPCRITLRQPLSEELQPKRRLESERSVRRDTCSVLQLNVGAELQIAVVYAPAFNCLDQRSTDA